MRILIYDGTSSDPWVGDVLHVPRIGEAIHLWDRSPVVPLLVRKVILRLPEQEVYVHCDPKPLAPSEAVGHIGEANITINGVTLNPQQAMTFRVAMSSFLADTIKERESLGGWPPTLLETQGQEVEAMLLVKDTMSTHDQVRRDRAEKCDLNDLDSLADAIRGLQSTDDPSLLPLHDKLMAQWVKLADKQNLHLNRGEK